MNNIHQNSQPSSDAMAMMRYDANKKTVGVAYLLWFFLGGLGVHRFYLGSSIMGLVILACTILGFVTLFTFIISAIILLVDAFLIPSMVREKNLAIAAEIGIGVPVS